MRSIINTCRNTSLAASLLLLLTGCFDGSSRENPPTTPTPDPIVCEAPEIANDSGDACVLPEPTVTPADNEAIIFYNRSDANYEGWVLHLWNNDTCPNTVAEPTNWPEGPSVAGVDPVYGGYFIIPLMEGYSDCMNFIVHDAAGVKDISQQDLMMNLTGSRMVWTLSGVNDVFTEPTVEVAVAVTGAAAHWVTTNTLIWNVDTDAISEVRLYHSMTASLTLEEDGTISGGEYVTLAMGATENDPAAELIKHANWPAFHLDVTNEQVSNLIRSQLLAVSLDAEGKVIAATQVQMPRLLDSLFTAGDNDADEQSLGLHYTEQGIQAAVWAPTAQQMKLNIYNADKSLQSSMDMAYDANTGIWSSDISADMDRLFYRFEITVYHPVSGNVETLEVTDPYSVSLSANGRYSQFVDLTDADLKPDNWDTHNVPTIANPEDAVIYEGHIRDFSVLDETVNSASRGKYMAFAEPNSVPMQHLQTLAEAGLTHFHLLPANDIASIEENPENTVDINDTVGDLCAINSNASVCTTHDSTSTLLSVFESFDPATTDAQQLANDMRNSDSFNWGYDPHHFNTPDGSYASDADGVARIKEMRAMVQGLHNVGLRVALDVVYNHTNASGINTNSVMDKLVPGYYHRYNATTGNIERSTCCENTATEHRMMEKFMVDSLVMWAEQYKYDAFRFDLMGHIPKSSILAARSAVQAVDADNYFYGEGWDFGEVAGDQLFEQATQKNMANTEVGTFNDQIREAVRGAAIFSGNSSSGTLVVQDKIRMSLAGTLTDYQLVNSNNAYVKTSSLGGYAGDPADIINYVSKHDNETLWDQLNYTLPESISLENRVRAQNISMAIPLLSQGVPFLQIGGDFLRSKSMDRNSYDAGDWANKVDFSLQTSNWNSGLPSQQENGSKYEQIAAMLADSNRAPSASDIQFAASVFQEFLRIRSGSPLFRLTNAEEIKNRIGFHNVGSDQTGGLIVMSIDDGTGLTDLDPANDALVLIINGTDSALTHNIPTAQGFTLHAIQANSVDANIRTAQFSATAEGGDFTVPAYSLAVFVKPQGGQQGTGLSPFATIGTPDTAPFGDTSVYLRGSMNGWGTGNSYSYTSDGVYQLSITLDAGTDYEFKIASEDWSTVDFGASGDTTVQLNTTLALMRSGANMHFTPNESGSYVFSLDASDSESPTLTVKVEEPYAGTRVYLRGSMNGWSENDAFTYIGSGQYEVSVALTAGDYEFKVASSDWSTVNFGANSALAVNSTVDLVNGGSNIALSVTSDGTYVFTFDAANLDSPTISVYQAGMYGATEVYVRGTMNGWGTDDVFSFDGSHIYTAQLTLGVGNYEFKIASADWNTVDFGAGQAGNQLQLGQGLQLARVGGDISLSITEAGNYQFQLRGPNPDAPKIKISKL